MKKRQNIEWAKLEIFKSKWLARFFGLPLSGVAMVMSLTTLPTQAFDYSMTSNLPEESSTQVVVTTTGSEFHFPLGSTLGLSQGYHFAHKGADLRAPRGEAVLAMSDGIVVETKKLSFGYGHYVRIAHKGTVSSLYAHLDKVEVGTGQRVIKGQKIGTVGMTGWTTGPHLHFEIYDGEKPLNPMGYIPAN